MVMTQVLFLPISVLFMNGLAGTRTHSKKETAKAKIDRYLMTLGEIMT